MSMFFCVDVALKMISSIGGYRVSDYRTNGIGRITSVLQYNYKPVYRTSVCSSWLRYTRLQSLLI